MVKKKKTDAKPQVPLCRCEGHRTSVNGICEACLGRIAYQDSTQRALLRESHIRSTRDAKAPDNAPQVIQGASSPSKPKPSGKPKGNPPPSLDDVSRDTIDAQISPTLAGTSPEEQTKVSSSGVQIVKVKKSLVVALLVSAGFKTAPSFTEARIHKKIAELPAMDWEGKTPSSPKLLESLISAVENNKPVTLLEVAEAEADEDQAEEAPKAKASKKAKAKEVEEEAPAPAAKASKKAKKVKEAQPELFESDDEEVDEEPPKAKKEKASKKAKAEVEEGAPEESATPKKVKAGAGKKVQEEAKAAKKGTKPAAKADKPAKKAKAEADGKKPGVIAHIITMLTKATLKKPISKEGLLEGLVAAFPDRTPDAMMCTINAQVPSRIRKERGLVISKNDKGYWVESDSE